MNITKYVWMALVAIAVVLLAVSGNVAAAVLIAPAAAADIDDLAEKMAGASASFKAAHKEIKEAHGELMAKMGEQRTEVSKELKDAIDKVITDFQKKFGEITTQLSEVEQKAVEAKRNVDSEEKSWGQQFVEGAFKSRIESEGSSFTGVARQEVKAVTSANAGGLIRSFRENDVVNLLRERQTIADLLPTIAVTTSSVDYVTQTLRTNNAAPVAESATKPYSEYAWGSATAVIRTLAHLAKITRQAMDDAPRLVGEIDSEMRYGLGYVKERQYLYGSGVGQNIHGIMPQATVFALPAGFTRRNGTTKIDVLRVAMLQNSLALLPATGIVLNEVDWADIELTKTEDGAYLMANPQGSIDARLWTLPIVATPAMAAGDFLVGNFALGAVEYSRMTVEVLISTENADDFETNRATMRAEERVGLAVKRAAAFTKGTFTTAITAINEP